MRDKEMKLVGKNAIVTGAAGGIGYSMADALMTHGRKYVAILDVKDEMGEESAKKLTADHKG